MSTHNICFHGEIRKIICGYPLLSGAVHKPLHHQDLQFGTLIVIFIVD